MHRHRMRAFVTGSGDTDVPVAIFAAGQFLRYISPAVGVITSSLGPGTTTINALATWGDTTGTQLLNTSVLLDSSGNMTNLVTLDAQDAPNITAKIGTDPAVGEITVWASASAPWKLGRRVVTVNPTGDMDNVNTLNGRAPGILVGRSPTSAPSTNSVMVSADGTGIVARGTPVLIDSSGNITGVLSINSVTPGTWVSGPASSVNNRLATFNGTTGKIIQDASGITASGNALGSVNTINGSAVFSGPGSATTNGIPRFTSANIVADSAATVDASGNVVVLTLNGVTPSTWVVGPASATSGGLAVFNGTTGKLIASGVTITASGTTLSGVTAINSIGFGSTSISGITAINSIDPATWVRGPSSSTANHLATFNNTTGKLIDDLTTITAFGGAMNGVATLDGIDPTTWVVGPASATDSRVALFNSTTGKLIKQAVVGIDSSGNITGAGTIAAGNITAGTYNSVTVEAHAARHAPSGADPIAQAVTAYAITAGTITSAGGLTGGLSLSITKRAGAYNVRIEWHVPLTFPDTSTSINFTVSSTASSGRYLVHTPNSAGNAAYSTVGTYLAVTLSGALIVSTKFAVPSGSGTAGILLDLYSGGSNITLEDGGTVTISEMT